MSSPGSSRRHICHPRFVLNSTFNWENTTTLVLSSLHVLPVSSTSRSESAPVMKSFLPELQEYDLFMLTRGLFEPRPLSFPLTFDPSRLLPHWQGELTSPDTF